jgi:hypothetical protein
MSNRTIFIVVLPSIIASLSFIGFSFLAAFDFASGAASWNKFPWSFPLWQATGLWNLPATEGARVPESGIKS